MNYFEIFNKVLLELNYRPVTNFDTIYKSEHIKILNAINSVNNEVLASYGWPFLERNISVELKKDENVYKLPFKGNIIAVYQGNTRFSYTPDAHELLSGKLCGKLYSVSDGSIIFEKACEKRGYRVVYETDSYAADENGAFKSKLEKKGDSSILPMPFAEHILVYGACLKIKANPSYPKFGFWNTMYINSLRNLLQKSPQTNECGPFITLS